MLDFWQRSAWAVNQTLYIPRQKVEWGTPKGMEWSSRPWETPTYLKSLQRNRRHFGLCLERLNFWQLCCFFAWWLHTSLELSVIQAQWQSCTMGLPPGLINPTSYRMPHQMLHRGKTLCVLLANYTVALIDHIRNSVLFPHALFTFYITHTSVCYVV